MPVTTVVLEDRRLPGSGERLLVKGVLDQLADRERHRPMLQNLLDVQVEGLAALIEISRTGHVSHHWSSVPQLAAPDHLRKLTNRTAPTNTLKRWNLHDQGLHFATSYEVPVVISLCLGYSPFGCDCAGKRHWLGGI